MKDTKSESVNTNQELAELMLKHNLTGQDVADLIEVTLSSVINWGRISRPTAMPRVALLALRLSIESGRLSELEKPT